MTDTELLMFATEFRFPYGLFPSQYISVQIRDGVKGPMFCVMRNSEVLNKKGKWEYEPMPSSRTDAFIKRTRFLRQEAIDLALKEIKRSFLP